MNMQAPHGSHDEQTNIVRAKESQLERMRRLQATLESAWEREVAAQKEKDAEAQQLMDRDPSGHIEHMKMEQEHRRLALELPVILLKREAEVFQEMQRAQSAEAAGKPGVGRLMADMIAMARWSQVPLLALGLWLIFSPFTVGYPSLLLTWNDIVSGILVMALALVVLRTGRSWAAWGNAVIGTWLAFAPVAFWAPDAASYSNDTLVGVFVVVFSVLIPMMMKMPGPEVPLGWSYNPSTWLQRAPVIGLAVVAFLLTRYMAAYQLGHIDSVWDPFFGEGTAVVLDSDVSKMFPISDAGAGAWIYLVEALMGVMGDPRRWRTMPWMVSLFGLLVVPLGIASIVLVVVQAVIVGAWCGICLITAVLMTLMIALSLDEILAMIEYLGQARRAGKPVWNTFWFGGNALGDNLTPRRSEAMSRPGAMFWGVTVPWNLIVAAVLGAWLMAAPAVLQLQGLEATVDYVIGPSIWVVALISLAEVGRALRLANALLAIALIVLPWLGGGGTVVSALNNLAVGALVVAVSVPPGKIRNTYGRWNRLVV